MLSRLVPALAVIILLGFGPHDVEKDSCLLLRGSIQKEADCSQFKGEGFGEAKNVIFLIGDGMGLNQIYAGRVFVSGPDNLFAWEDFKHRGLVTTCSLSGVTDSAAAGTALATGHKTKNAIIGMDPTGREKYETVIEMVKSYKATGIVTTATVYDATPAAFTAHVFSRDLGEEIARQQVEESGADVIMGGGRDEFKGGDDEDNLLAQARDMGYTVVTNRDQILGLDLTNVKKLLGLFAENDIPWENHWPEDSGAAHLTDMTRAALTVLGQDPRGFFLMIEGAKIDDACHKVDENKLVYEMAEFNRAIELVMAFAKANPGTLVVITADHETGGTKIKADDYDQGDIVDLIFTSLIIPGHAKHSGQQVAIFAEGPNAGAVRPHMDNTEVYCVLKNAFPPPLALQPQGGVQ